MNREKNKTVVTVLTINVVVIIVIGLNVEWLRKAQC